MHGVDQNTIFGWFFFFLGPTEGAAAGKQVVTCIVDGFSVVAVWRWLWLWRIEKIAEKVFFFWFLHIIIYCIVLLAKVKVN